MAQALSQKSTLCMGELMIRLKSPERTRLFQQPLLEASAGGAEANVAVALSRLGGAASFISTIPANPVGDFGVAELKKEGVATDLIRRDGDRMGLYFLEAGACHRPSRVIYDRSSSAMAETPPEAYDWSRLMEAGDWLHISGITPALSPESRDTALRAVQEAKDHGLTVSCDLNFRSKLWNYGQKAPEVMVPLMEYVDIAVANEEDCQKCLGIESPAQVASGRLEETHYRELARKVRERFPQLKILAITLREALSADHNLWSAVLQTEEQFFRSRQYDIFPIVDRVGAGDSFSAGLIHSLKKGDDPRRALEFATAAACLNHSIPGDWALISEAEVLKLMEGDGSGRVQR